MRRQKEKIVFTIFFSLFITTTRSTSSSCHNNGWDHVETVTIQDGRSSVKEYPVENEIIKIIEPGPYKILLSRKLRALGIVPRTVRSYNTLSSLNLQRVCLNIHELRGKQISYVCIDEFEPGLSNIEVYVDGDLPEQGGLFWTEYIATYVQGLDTPTKNRKAGEENENEERKVATTESYVETRRKRNIFSYFPKTERKRFTIRVLTMNRAASLRRLLASLENTAYKGDKVDMYIHVDHHHDNLECIQIAKNFHFSHGSVTVHVSKKNKGLRDAWLNVWVPSDDDHAVIFEDDMEVSPLWYSWLKGAWKAYEDRNDIAGISLQIQTLMPKLPHRNNWTPGFNKSPFLYSLVGSWGFSPHPIYWKSFLHWMNEQDLLTLDVKIPGLVTSEWWKHFDRKSMWTQYFLYFCIHNNLYTLYPNVPARKTLTAHWREIGVHSNIYRGKDFPLAKKMFNLYPKFLVKYGFDGLPKPTVVIVGAMKNAHSAQVATFHSIEKLQETFNIASVIIYENASKDETLQGLQDWKNSSQLLIEIISEKEMKFTPTDDKDEQTVKVQTLAYIRNKLLERATKIKPQADYIFSIDLDGVSSMLKGVETCFDLPVNWGGCCANQAGTYYDLWALRTYDEWNDCDVWRDKQCNKKLAEKYVVIPKSSGPIPVQSCFGGAVLYNFRTLKKAIEKNVKYNEKGNTCEHVEFHKSLRSVDPKFQMYIQPRMLNSPQENHVHTTRTQIVDNTIKLFG